jgi:hypothetical protein
MRVEKQLRAGANFTIILQTTFAAIRLMLFFFTYDVDQAWATHGPRARSGPQGTLMGPASYNSYFYVEKMLKIQKNSILS